MSSTIKLDKDESGEVVDITMRRGMKGSLCYIMTSTLDIMFNICFVLELSI